MIFQHHRYSITLTQYETVRCLVGNVEELSDLQVTFNIPAFSGTHGREDPELQLSNSVEDFLVALARTLGRLKKVRMACMMSKFDGY